MTGSMVREVARRIIPSARNRTRKTGRHSMPATTIVVHESSRWIQSRLRRAAEGLPVRVFGSRSVEELSLRLNAAPQSIAIIEESSTTQALQAVRAARESASAVFVVTDGEPLAAQSALLRLAGAAGVVVPTASLDFWRVWVQRLSAENQTRLLAAGGRQIDSGGPA